MKRSLWITWYTLFSRMLFYLNGWMVRWWFPRTETKFFGWASLSHTYPMDSYLELQITRRFSFGCLVNTTISCIYIYMYKPRTQMGPLVLFGKGLVLEGWPSKIEDIGVLGRLWIIQFKKTFIDGWPSGSTLTITNCLALGYQDFFWTIRAKRAKLRCWQWKSKVAQGNSCNFSWHVEPRKKNTALLAMKSWLFNGDPCNCLL